MNRLVRWIPAVDRFVVDESMAAALLAGPVDATAADELARGLRDALLLRERVGVTPPRPRSMTDGKEVA